MLIPKLFTTLKDYSKEQFISDAVAGIIVGILAIPLAIAFAIASGVSPEKGLITAVVAGLLISAFGGSRVQIGGPTGAFVVIIYGIVHKYGIDGLVLATLMAGVLLMIMGFARFGTIIKFIPHSVIVGFTSGIAVIIFSSQVKDFLGLGIGAVPAEFLPKWALFFQNIRSVNLWALALALLTVLISVIWPKVTKKIPGALVAIILTSAVVAFFKLPVETIGSRFGDLPHGIPMPHMPSISLSRIQELFQPAFTIAMLGAIESLLSAVVADGMMGSRHRSNMELVGQGIGNIGSAFFGGIPATGAIARTVTNIRNGGKTPIAGIIHSITVFIIMLALGALIKVVPLACLAGILVIIAYNMSEWRSFKELLKTTGGARAVLLTTFFVTIFIDLTAAIELGLVLSAFIFIKRMSELTNIKIMVKEINDDERDNDRISKTIALPEGVQVYEINGPLFFGAANSFEESDRAIGEKPKIRILRFRNVPLIDSTGMHALKGFYEKSKKSGVHLIITGLHIQPLNEMVKANLYDLIGEENVFAGMKDSIARAKELLKQG